MPVDLLRLPQKLGDSHHHMRLSTDIIFALIPISLFAVLVAWDIQLPGLYMDAVNPDYLVMRYLEPRSILLPHWSIHSLMPSLYHGEQHVWFGLPVYAITGTTIEALRAVHATFGAGILLCLYIFIRRLTTPFVAALALIPLACEPSFLMAFRTQSYITLAPTLWLLLSLLLLTGKATPSPWRCLVSGWAMGWAIYGYFIYLFFFPVLTFVAWHRAISSNSANRFSHLTLLAWWLSGVTLGLIFYLFGYFSLLWQHRGLTGLFNYLKQAQANLGVFESTQSPMDRLIYAFTRFWLVLSNSWHNSMIFKESTPGSGSILKIPILLCGSTVALIAPSTRRFAKLLLILGMAFLLIGLIFGSRLNGHHYVWAIPFFYGLGGAGFVALFDRSGTPKNLASCVLTGVVFINFYALHQLYTKLEHTGGVGLFSDAITKFSEQAATQPTGNHYFFPQWGLFMPFAFITGGRVPYSVDIGDPALTKALCKNKPVIIALPGADRRTAMLEYAAKLHASVGETVTHTQRDGKIALETAPMFPAPGVCTAMASRESGFASALGKFRAEPSVIRSCDSSLGKTILYWNVPEADNVEIHVNAPDGTLFVKGSAQGSQETGRWVKDGTTFYLLQAASKKIIATVSVPVTDEGCW
jgi:hypothetical protein